MPVNSTHSDYGKFADKWKRIRDTIAGSDEVKAEGTTYLPKPKGHDDEDYGGYKMRAEFYPATTRTVDGLQGAIFRKEPNVTVPNGQDDFIEHLTIQGTDFTTFSKNVTKETLMVGRYGVLVDVASEGEDRTPFAAGYTAENILNWRVSFIERTPTLTLLVLREIVAQPDEDGFATKEVEQYRVCQFGSMIEGDFKGKGNVYVQTLYEKREENKKESIVQISKTVPTRRGEALKKIPFTFFGPTDLTPGIQKPPILDLVDTNLSHYRTSGELEEGAYFTGLPMYVISGRTMGEDEPASFNVGSRSALRLDEGGSANVLTVNGDGMGLLLKLLEAKEQRMAVLGARILEDQKAGVEAAATLAMRHRGENSLLGSIADTVGRGMKDVLEDLIFWNGVDDPEITVELNKDFTSLQLTGAELVQLVTAFQSGTIGPEVFFKMLKDGERIPDGWTMEDWLADIESGMDAFAKGLTNEGTEPPPPGKDDDEDEDDKGDGEDEDEG